MKIYTRTGDSGETGLWGGQRVSKDAARVEVYGTVDELNAALGLARAEPLSEDLDRVLQCLQHELFSLGQELAAGKPSGQSPTRIGPTHIANLEAEIDRREASLGPLKQFLLPGGTRTAAALHLGRTICRRAERRLVWAIRVGGEEFSPSLVAYLNRLGDLLFVLARSANAQAGCEDVAWKKPPA